AVAIERTARLLRIVVALRQRAHRVEAADAERGDRRLRSTRDRSFDIAALDPARGFTDRVRARGARTGDRVARAFQTVANRDLARRQVRDRARNEVRRHTPRTLLAQHVVLLLDQTEPAHPDTHERAGELLQIVARLEAGVLDGLDAGTHREVDEAVPL